MAKQEQLEEMAKDICKSCQTRLTPTMKCTRNCCAMAEVVAENLCNIGYKQEKEVAKEIVVFLKQFEGYANIAAEELSEKYRIELE